MLTAVDLFCGAGGMSLGFSKAGFRVVGAVDNWTPAVKTYSRNFSYPVILADLRALPDEELRGFLGFSAGRVDLLIADPPCRGFSPRRYDSGNDSRIELVFEFVRMVKALRPRMFLMGYKPWGQIKRDAELARRFEAALKSFGYGVGSQVVNAAEYGVPQARKRLFYYGWSAAELSEFRLPPPTHVETFRTVIEAIRDLPPPPLDRTSAHDPLHYRIRMGDVNLERLRHVPPGGSIENVPDDLKPYYYYRHRHYRGNYRGAYGRLDPDRPAAAIIEGFDSFTRGRFGHPFEDRNITLREGARLQTFPDDFIFEGGQREITALIGNATAPLLAEVIARACAVHLKRGSKSTRAPRPLPPATTVRENRSLAVAVQARLEFPTETQREAARRPAVSISPTGQFRSCFISYSSKDQKLANMLSADLKARGVRCWFAPHDLKIGEKFRDKIDESIRFHDKFLLILSKNSVASPWVEKEVETALEHESQNRCTVVFPVRLDDAVMKIKTGWPADIRRTRHIGDFRCWEDMGSYKEAFARLLRDLRDGE
ncbi:MAG: DNA (cytosine-5-)-methyltransferase [Pyrinomonadaceae bacterium]